MDRNDARILSLVSDLAVIKEVDAELAAHLIQRGVVGLDALLHRVLRVIGVNHFIFCFHALSCTNEIEIINAMLHINIWSLNHPPSVPLQCTGDMRSEHAQTLICRSHRRFG